MLKFNRQTKSRRGNATPRGNWLLKRSPFWLHYCASLGSELPQHYGAPSALGMTVLMRLYALFTYVQHSLRVEKS